MVLTVVTKKQEAGRANNRYEDPQSTTRKPKEARYFAMGDLVGGSHRGLGRLVGIF